MTPRDLVSRFYTDVINAKRLDVLDVLVADEFIEHGTPPTVGREGFRAFLVGLMNGLPDVELRVDDWVVGEAHGIAPGRYRGMSTFDQSA